ncbi:hypothetical protein GUITHDRAFT_109489 [Guillardia theta CCMP2712]|uniref:Uncharacterized protein n=1 Tax=Guillardia theta (strain CCMP2712) TaxID=905079 RepID=L1J851_GUITC|nr:hypothetical protein GUITHDRAFT_109489 [Guillardia theta CCMP2712]EKX44711.1 hypothetical protein GUITHDRAFT_109489 [Guillardia theta CCMP2712]|eukprot:XP_005831691.1 hypothetical protein GUITHDRAFT_109489 [Guillardia theta CCMP2712]
MSVKLVFKEFGECDQYCLFAKGQYGFWIVDSYNSPSSQPWRQSWTNIDTRYAGGSGTTSFSGGETPIADGYSAASYGSPHYSYSWY